MARDGGSGVDPDVAKKKVLNLDKLFAPATLVQTSIGTMYLYGLRVSDVSALADLAATEPIGRVRAFLPCIASMTEAKGFKDERQPPTPEDLNLLTDADIERIADAYAATLMHSSTGNAEAAAQPQRLPNEDAATYLDRLLKHEVDDQVRQMRATREKMLASTSSIFDQVRKSTTSLGSTLSDFHHLTTSARPSELRVPSMDHLHAVNEQFARQARERAEELEMVRLTGKMTAQSAQTLKDLAEAATVLLEQMDARDKRTDTSTRKQITVAVWSVVVSAVLALLALIVSGFAYYQDKANNQAGDKWQSDLVRAVRDGNLQRAAAEEEARRLRDQVAVLESKVARIESAQSDAVSAKSAASAARRATSPGSTLPAP